MSGEKLTKAQAAALQFILSAGPGALPPTSTGRVTAAVQGLLDRGLLEELNKLRPGPPMYEITAAGRVALKARRVR